MPVTATIVHPKSLGEIPKAFHDWWAKYHVHLQSRIRFSRSPGAGNLLVIRSRPGPGLRFCVQENELWHEVAGKKLHLVLDNFDVSTKVKDELVLYEIRLRTSHSFLRQSVAAVENAKNPLFFRRAINALSGLEDVLSHESIAEATAASTDLLVLLKALTAPAVAPELAAKDPLAAARLRGAQRQQKMLEESGGALNGAEVAEILNISRQAVDKRRRQGQLIGLTQGRRGYAFPVWQFEGGKTIPNLEDVLDSLRGHDPWMQFAFFINPNDRLEGKTPLDRLRAGELEPVLRAAESYGEHGAA
jgi:hypothetical protein